MMYKINIVGAYGETNFGDDLLMCVFENFFLQEFQNVELNFIGEPNPYAKRFLLKSNYLAPNFTPDWEVYGGGTQFFAFKEHSKSSIADKIRLIINNPDFVRKKLENLLFPKKAQHFKTAFLGFGIGPFNNNEKAIFNAKHKIASADYVGVRDEVSKNYCDQWDISSILGADVVFSSYFNMPDLIKSNDDLTKRKIGIIVRDWEWEDSGKNYISKLLQFYKSYTDVELQFIVFAPSKDKNWLKKLKNMEPLVWDPSKYSIETFLNELVTFDGFISARYHGAIVGALLHKPVICVEVEPKLKSLTEQVQEINLWEKPFDLTQLKQLVDQLNYDIKYENALRERKEKADYMLLQFKNELK